MTLISLFVVIAVIALFWQRRRSKATPASTASAAPEATLSRLCHGDASKVARLIALELKAAPSISRSKAIERATYRLHRDNHQAGRPDKPEHRRGDVLIESPQYRITRAPFRALRSGLPSSNAPRMDPERKRALKKLGKAEVQRQSDEIRQILREANPADPTSDAWIKGHKLGTERERWLRKRLPTLHRPQLDALFVVRPYVGTGWVPTPGGYVQCEDCGSALPSMRPKSWFHSTGCRCGNIAWWELLWWRRITVRRPDRVIAIKLTGRG